MQLRPGPIWLLGWLVALATLVGCGATDRPAPPTAGADCVVRRAAFDIGSGTTKVKVADVDRCRDRLLQVLFAADAPSPYGDDVGRRDDDAPRLSDTTIAEGMDALRGLKTRADVHAPEAYAGVATAAFRRATNAAVVIARMDRELGIPVQVIEQTTEARLGFLGAVQRADVPAESAVVWDVGGRSMQLTTLADDGQLMIFRGDLASGQMREHVLHDLQRRSDGTHTPNPMSPEHAAAARRYAAAYARDQVPDAFKAKLARGGTVVLGIGAFKYYGDRSAADLGALCSPPQLARGIEELLGKSDEQIGGAYAATQVTDRALLAGFMEGLGVEGVQLVDVDLTDGLLVDAERWHAPEARP